MCKYLPLQFQMTLIDLEINLNFKEEVISLFHRSLLIEKLLTNKADNLTMYLTL